VIIDYRGFWSLAISLCILYHSYFTTSWWSCYVYLESSHLAQDCILTFFASLERRLFVVDILHHRKLSIKFLAPSAPNLLSLHIIFSFIVLSPEWFWTPSKDLHPWLTGLLLCPQCGQNGGEEESRFPSVNLEIVLHLLWAWIVCQERNSCISANKAHKVYTLDHCPNFLVTFGVPI